MPASIGTRVLAIVITAVLLVAGLLFFAGIAPGYQTSIIFGAAWVIVFGLVAGKVVKPRPELRWPVRATTLLVSSAIVIWVSVNTFTDKTVNETIVTGVPAATAAAGSSGAGNPAASAGAEPSADSPAASTGAEPGAAAKPAAPQNIERARGSFIRLSHGPSHGTAAVVDLAEGGRKLTFSEFETDNGPDLRVYLATDRGADEFKDLGGLKGNIGNQQYDVPVDLDLRKYDTVLIWCRAFSVGFAAAELG